MVFKISLIRSCDNCGRDNLNEDETLCRDCKPTRPRYVIAHVKVIKRPHIERGGELIIDWVPDLSYGTHNANVNAKRAFLKAMGEIPSDVYTSDSHVRAMFKAQQNMKIHKVIKIVTNK